MLSRNATCQVPSPSAEDKFAAPIRISLIWAAVVLLAAQIASALNAAPQSTSDLADGPRKPIPEKLVVLTFDDSSKSHFTVVRPLLLKYGFGATFFITEGFDFPDNNRDYMTWDEIAQLHRDGFEIGNHTRDHLSITDGNVPRLAEQLEGIVKRCQEHHIPPPVTFAWPGNATSLKALAILKQQGIRFARRGGAPEYPYDKGQGFAFQPGSDHPLLLPSAGDARPNWNLDDFIRAVQQAREGRIAIVQFHGTPDTAHSWVNTDPQNFEAYMHYLAVHQYKVIALRDLEQYAGTRVEPADALSVIRLRQQALSRAREGLAVDVAKVGPDAQVRVDISQSDLVAVEWPAGGGTRGIAKFRLSADQPLIESLSLRAADDAQPRIIARDLSPCTAITVGSRNLDTPGGWTIFFDKVHQRPFQRYGAELKLASVQAEARGSRGSISLGPLTAGPFSGKLVFSFCAGSPLIFAEAVVSTTEDRRAIIYDAGLVAAPGAVERYVWSDYDDQEKSQDASRGVAAGPRALRFRTVVAEMTGGGSVAVFPPPHRFFYPLDFADNFGFNWFGSDYLSAPKGDGWGIRQPPEGDRRFVPWVNSPPNTAQRLGAFYLLSTEGATAALDAVQRYTHSDRYVTLPGHKTFTSHYHVEHTLDLLNQQKATGSQDIPAGLQSPGFLRVFRASGIDIVHLAEFHNGETPKLATAERLRQLRAMHAECQRLSDDSFLLLPGEEPNVHLGGHWISLFPRPVLWVLNRPQGTPLEDRTPGGETVYHVGGADDVLALMQREKGLMWTAHARIKSSVGFPDGYRDRAFFTSPHFLGAAWKAMPADYSRDTLGWRVLDLLDEMNNWGKPKQVLGEVDVFKVQPAYEIYGHANINYVRLERLPCFVDGWAPLLEALREGRFFTTTGEILITDFAVARSSAKLPTLRAHLQWTFPLAHAEIVGGDGTSIFRHRVELSDTQELGQLDFAPQLPDDFAACRWLRLEVWDIATDGAFTQPIWLDIPQS